MYDELPMPREPQPSNTAAGLALALAVASVLCMASPLTWLLAPQLAFVAIVSGIVGLRRVRRVRTGAGAAVAGMILAVGTMSYMTVAFTHFAW